MKQHITIKQLNELSEKNKKKFREAFWKISDGDLLVYGDYKDRLGKEVIVFKYGMIPADEDNFGYKLLSIGQMIEFLDEKNYDWKNKLFAIENDLNGEPKRWITQHPRYFPFHSEFCDALWESVKEILEK